MAYEHVKHLPTIAHEAASAASAAAWEHKALPDTASLGNSDDAQKLVAHMIAQKDDIDLLLLAFEGPNATVLTSPDVLSRLRAKNIVPRGLKKPENAVTAPTVANAADDDDPTDAVAAWLLAQYHTVHNSLAAVDTHPIYVSYGQCIVLLYYM